MPGRPLEVAADVAALLAVVAALPFVILAVGLPVVLVLQLLLWVARLAT